MTTPVPPLSPVPEFPALSDRVTYNAKAFAWATHMRTTFPPEMKALADNALDNAGQAAASATLATGKADYAGAAMVGAEAAATAAGLSKSAAAGSASAAAGSAAAAGTKAGEALASAGVAAAKVGEAAAQVMLAGQEADRAAAKAAEAAASAAGISGGPVTSVNGKTGVVVLAATDTAPAATAAEMQAGIQAGYRSMSPALVAQAIAALANSGVTASETAPASPAAGMLWYQPSSKKLRKYDGATSVSATLSARGSGITQAGWTTPENAYDSGVDTFATWSSTTSNQTSTVYLTGYDFSAIHAGATVTGVSIDIRQYVSATNRMNAPDVRPYIGASAIGTNTTLTSSQTSSNAQTISQTLTLAQLQDAGFRMAFVAKHYNGAISGTQYLDYINVEVAYTYQVDVWTEVGDNSLRRADRPSNTALSAADKGMLIDASGTFTQTFAAAATLGDGWWCYLRNSGAGDITLDPSGAELIDGAATLVVKPGFTYLIQCDGATFRTLTLKRRTYDRKAFYFVSGSLIVPEDCYVIRPYAFGAGGTGTTTASGGGGGCAYGDIAVTPGEAVTITISAGVAKVTTQAVDRLIGNPASGITAGTASKHASVSNGGAYGGGAGVSAAGAGGASSGSPLGAGYSGGTGTGGGGSGFGGSGGPGSGGVGSTGGGVGGPGGGAYGGPGFAPESVIVDPLLFGLTGLGGTAGASSGISGGAGAGGGGSSSGSGTGGRGGFGGGGGGGSTGASSTGGAGGFGGGGGGGSSTGTGGAGGFGGGGGSSATPGTGGFAAVILFY